MTYYDIKHIKYDFGLKQRHVVNGWLPRLSGRLPLNFRSFHRSFPTGAHRESSNHLFK